MAHHNISTTDGTRLAAEVYRADTPACQGTAIFVHGFGGNRYENGLFRVIAEAIQRKGFNTVLYDWRGIESSQGNFATTSLDDPQLDFARSRGVAERVRHTVGEVAGEFLWVRALV